MQYESSGYQTMWGKSKSAADTVSPLMAAERRSRSSAESVGARIPWRPKVKARAEATLGTVMGVYVPCMLSIIGVILFLRLGWAVGHAGVLGTLLMFFLGGTMALLTDLSLSAMATNGRISGGGTYFLISRSVGPELGGAIGVMFYLANTLGIAFYMQGFTDTVAELAGFAGEGTKTYWLKFGLAAAVLALEAGIAVGGSSLYSKCAFWIFVIQMLAVAFGTISLLSRSPFQWEDLTGEKNAGLPNHFKLHEYGYVGPSLATLRENLWPDWGDIGCEQFATQKGCDTPDTQCKWQDTYHQTSNGSWVPDGSCVGNGATTFQKVFGIIFPAMTGIMAGTNMSGVLKRPELSIPRGELSALASSMLTYAIVIVALGCSVRRATLQTEYLVLTRVAYWPWGVTIGILVSTTSSALASIQSAARLLQAMGQDGVFPAFARFKATYNGEPALAVAVSIVVALLVLLVGSLNAIAPVLTMFFLITYATTNFATLLHTVAGHPNFRPRFRYFSWHTAALGLLSCLALMFYLQYVATVIAIVIMLALATYIARRSATAVGLRAGWGEVTQSLIFHQVRKYLLRLDDARAHVKFWRPQLLCLAKEPSRGREQAFDFLNNLKKGGLFIVGTVLPQQAGAPPPVGTVARRRETWQRFVSGAHLKAFVDIVSAPSFRLGLTNLLQASGLGGMRPNTAVLFCHSDDDGDGGAGANGGAGGTAPSSFEQAVDGQADQAVPKLSAHEFVNTIDDVAAFSMNLLVLRGFGKLDKQELVRRAQLSRDVKFRRRRGAMACGCDGRCGADAAATEAGEAGVLLSEDDAAARHPRPHWSESTVPDPRGVLHAHTDPSYARVDVWRVPPCWATQDGAVVAQASFSLALQLAAMLRRHDFWHKHTFLRVCGLVAADNDNFDATRAAFGDLHQAVVRDDRIRASIHVFILAEDAPALYRDNCVPADTARDEAKRQGSSVVPDACYGAGHPSNLADGGNAESAARAHMDKKKDDGMLAVPAARRDELLFKFINEQNKGAVVTFIPLPAPPRAADGGDAESAARAYMDKIRAMTAALGPVVFVRADPTQKVISTEL